MSPGGALRRWAAVSAAALVACLAGAAPATAANEDFFGVNAQALFALPSSSWDTHLAAMSGGGLQLVRRDAPWGSAEPKAPDPVTGAHTYVWTGFDQKVAAYARHGLRWVPIVDYSAPWAGEIAGDPYSPPAGNSNYASYAAALARRYGRGGDFWREHPELPQLPVTRYEIWNEENASYFWHPQTTAPERYADLYLATRAALKGVDPAARVIVGGLTLANTNVTSETEFVERMYVHRPDLEGNVDAVGFHPYMGTIDGVYSKLRAFRQTLESVGAGTVPLEITEIGWTTVSTSDADRGSMLSRLAYELPRSDCGIASLIPHTWITGELDATNPEDWFGIVNADGTPKPSGSAYLGAVSRMRGLGGGAAAPTGTVQICGTTSTGPAPEASGGSPESTPTSGSTHTGSGGEAATGGKTATTTLRGPKLRLRVVNRRRGQRRRLVATLRCPRGCRAQLELMRAVRGRRAGDSSSGSLARRVLAFSSSRRVVRLRVPRGQRVLDLRVTATGPGGGVTVRTKRLRLRRPL